MPVDLSAQATPSRIQVNIDSAEEFTA